MKQTPNQALEETLGSLRVPQLSRTAMKEQWSYEKKKRVDSRGNRWHFMHRHFLSTDQAYQDQPDELYFRDDARAVFGLLRFEHRKDNPYRDYELVVRKIMEDADFRTALLDPGTEDVWRGR